MEGEESFKIRRDSHVNFIKDDPYKGMWEGVALG